MRESTPPKFGKPENELGYGFFLIGKLVCIASAQTCQYSPTASLSPLVLVAIVNALIIVIYALKLFVLQST